VNEMPTELRLSVRTQGGAPVPGTLGWLLENASYLLLCERQPSHLGPSPAGQELVLVDARHRPMARLAMRTWREESPGRYAARVEYLCKDNVHRHCCVPPAADTLALLTRIAEMIRPWFDAPAEGARLVRVHLVPYSEQAGALLKAACNDPVAAAALHDLAHEVEAELDEAYDEWPDQEDYLAMPVPLPPDVSGEGDVMAQVPALPQDRQRVVPPSGDLPSAEPATDDPDNMPF
jgi:hypothetical protein